MGKICKFTIFNGQSIRCDTIFRGLAMYPAISFDGKRVAFYRFGATVDYANNRLIGSLSDSGWISVVDTSGQNLRNLVRVATTLCRNPQWASSAIVSWPSGDWIYYEKPCKSGEFWRVNINDPAHSNQLVVKYVKAQRNLCENSTCPDLYDGNSDSWTIRTFQLAKNATLTTGHYYGYSGVQNYVHCFPMPGGDYMNASCLKGSRGGCNGALTPGGHYLAFWGGSHTVLSISMITPTGITDNKIPQVSRNITLSDVSTWAGSREFPWAFTNRAATNSEKWVLQMVCHYYGCVTEQAGTDQVAVNWVDRTAIRISSNPYFDNCAPNGCFSFQNMTGPAYGSDAGDLYVDGGPENAGKYEDVNGTWIAVPPVDPVSAIAPRSFGRARNSGYPSTHLVIAESAANLGKAGRADIMDLRGRLVVCHSAAGMTARPGRGFKGAGAYFVRFVDEK